MLQRGELVANGRTSSVYAYGADSVVKVQRPGVPEEWSELEARFTAIVHSVGVPSPEVRGTIEIDGRVSTVFERVRGPSMWDLIIEQPADSARYASELASIQREIFQAPLAPGIPDLVDRMCAKISGVCQLDGEEKAEACGLVRSLPRGAALLHGDLHPGNVLMSTRGPVAIDWFDAAIGHPAADVARTSLLIHAPRSGREHQHLPGGSPDILNRFRSHYLEGVDEISGFTGRDMSVWESVVAASRLAENVQIEESDLLDIWRQRERS